MRSTKLARQLQPFLHPGSAVVALSPQAGGGDDHPPATGGPGIVVDGNQIVSLDPVVAGAGLQYAGGIVNLGAPSTLSATSANSAAGTTHTHAVAAETDVSGGQSALLKSNAGNLRLQSLHVVTITTAVGNVTLSPVGNIVLTPGGAVTLTNGKALSTSSFASGFVGYGFRLDQGIGEAGKTTLELDNLWVRGRLHVYELLIHQIRAANGSLFVSSTGKVAALTYISGANWQIDTDPEHGFAAGDLKSVLVKEARQ